MSIYLKNNCKFTYDNYPLKPEGMSLYLSGLYCLMALLFVFLDQ